MVVTDCGKTGARSQQAWVIASAGVVLRMPKGDPGRAQDGCVFGVAIALVLERSPTIGPLSGCEIKRPSQLRNVLQKTVAA